MKKLFSLPGLIVSGMFLILAFVLIDKTMEESHAFKEEKNKIAEILNFKDRLLSLRDWVFSETAWQEKKVKYDAVLAKSEIHYNKAVSYGHYLLFASLGFLLIVILIYAKKRIYFGITLGLAVVGIAFLVQGIMNPILEMAAFEEDMTFKIYVKPKDIPYYQDAIDKIDKFGGLADNLEFIPFFGDAMASGSKTAINEIVDFMNENSDKEFGKDQVFRGKTFFYYQNKGIMDVISLLWNNNNKPVAMAIGTFSVIVPLIKLLFSLIILIFPITRAKKLRKVLSYIAKWSMADVFVIGAFLAYLSFANMSPGVQMDANVLFGLYYFGGYVIISIVMGMMLDLSIKEKIRIKEEEDSMPKIDVIQRDGLAKNFIDEEEHNKLD
jgi:paraquat-inducible protein A